MRKSIITDDMEHCYLCGTFMNKQKQDTRRRRFVAPIVVAIVMSVLMAGLIWLFLWAFEVDPAGAPPLPVLALFVGEKLTLIF